MEKSMKVIISSLIINTVLTILKIITGFIGQSTALIADGIHSLSDLVTDIFSMIGSYIANKPADDKHPFGHGKMEYIISLGISCVVIFIGLLLIETGIKSDLEMPETIVLFVSLTCILIKFILAKYIETKGKEYDNNILIAGAIESKMDVYSSLVVLISTIMMLFSDKIAIFKYADKTAIILVALMIIKVGIDLLIENGSLLLEEKILDEDYNNQIKSIILKHDEVIDIKLMHVFKYGSHYKLTAQIIMDNQISLIDAYSIIEIIEKDLQKNHNFEYIFINMEPISEYVEEILKDH